MKENFKICVGDEVRVTGGITFVYYAYSNWSHLTGFENNFVCYATPSQYKIYKVLLVEKHDRDNRTTVLIQDQDTTQVFIVDAEGVKVIT